MRLFEQVHAVRLAELIWNGYGEADRLHCLLEAHLKAQAETGIYDQTAQTLTLEGPIDVFSDRGYEFHGTGGAIGHRHGSATLIMERE